MQRERTASLAEIESTLWAELAQATHVRGHAWRVLALATVEGARAAVRSVLLRGVQAGHKKLVFYTDTRSPKVAQLRAQPQGSLLAWSAPLAWQLRLEVSLTLADSGSDVTARWAELQHSASAQDYLTAQPPGTPLKGYASAPAASHHFGIVTAQVTAIEWLELHADGHRRARFDGHGARWLAP